MSSIIQHEDGTYTERRGVEQATVNPESVCGQISLPEQAQAPTTTEEEV